MLERKAVELQRAADRNNIKKGPVHLKSTDGMETHFQKLLNAPGDTDHEALDNIPQRITSPVQGYQQEKPEAERHKDRLMDITLTAER